MSTSGTKLFRSLSLLLCFFPEKIAYKEDSAKPPGMERTYSRVIHRASSSMPAANTPANPDAWLQQGEQHTASGRSGVWGGVCSLLFGVFFPFRLMVLKIKLMDNTRKRIWRFKILIYWKSSQCYFLKMQAWEFFFFACPNICTFPLFFFFLFFGQFLVLNSLY